MSTGRTLWLELCYRYHAGVDDVIKMKQAWATLSGRIDPELYRHVQDKLVIQEQDAVIWRDTCLSYFQTFSKMPFPKHGSDDERR